MGVSAEKCAKYYNLTREDQDSPAMKSYRRSQKAHESGKFENEMNPVIIPCDFEDEHQLMRTVLNQLLRSKSQRKMVLLQLLMHHQLMMVVHYQFRVLMKN